MKKIDIPVDIPVLFILMPWLIIKLDPKGIHGISAIILPVYLAAALSLFIHLKRKSAKGRYRVTQEINEIEADFKTTAEKIGAPITLLPTYGYSIDGGHPHIEVKNGEYHYISVERGREQSHRRTKNLDNLKYWTFSDVTHGMAFKYELENRTENQDCRRIAFPRQVELMSLIDKDYGVKMQASIEEILRQNPYDDEPTRLSMKSSNKAMGQSFE